MNVSEELIREVVKRVLAESAKAETPKEDFVKEKDPSGILKIQTNTVKCEPFQQEGVALKDVVTLEEAPRMGCGIMELDHTSFEWTLTYDEYDLVIDGVLEIEIDGRVVTGNPGDIIYIPKIPISTSRLLPRPDMRISYIRQTGSKKEREAWIFALYGLKKKRSLREMW